MGKEVFGSTSTPQSSTFLYAPSTTDNFDTSAAVCNLAIRFQQGDAATFDGYSLFNFKTTTAPFAITVASVAGSSPTSTECNAVKNNSNGSTRYRMTFRVFTDSSGNGVAKLESNGDLYKRVSGSWTLVTDTAGCLANGMTYFKVSNAFTVYQTSTCWLNAGVTVTGSPMYNFTYGALTLNASATDLSSQTCFQNGTASYKLNNTLTNPTLFRFSSTSCAANPTVDATTRLTNLTAGCSSLNASDYAYNNSAILKVVSTSFSCSTPACITIGDCQMDSCYYNPSHMASKVNCSVQGGVAMGMIYVKNFETSTYAATTTAPSTTSTIDNQQPLPTNPGGGSSAKLSAGMIAAATVVPVVLVAVAVGLFIFLGAAGKIARAIQARKAAKAARAAGVAKEAVVHSEAVAGVRATELA
ncbi:hypothetical protein DFS34DRAFT_631349 [Phlyctochytrium arcticum]|nr:hypothetical protein DFS34DRAFT_631349 [Phlyctochytrium arcticum]